MHRVTENAYQQYVRSRPAASSDSNRRVKELNLSSCGVLSIFSSPDENAENEMESLIDRMKNYRPHGVSYNKNKFCDCIT